MINPSNMLSLEFLATALVVVLIPGTGVIYTLTNAILHGGRASVAAAIGCTVGIIPHVLASLLGLAALLHTSALAFQLVKLLGVLYLLYLAWGLWRETSAVTLQKTDCRTEPSWHELVLIAVRGAVINILNPKLSLFFLAFLPQFIPAAATDVMLRMSLLSAVFMLLTLVVFIGYGLGANTMRQYVLSSKRITCWMQRTFAGIFAGFAVKLALTER